MNRKVWICSLYLSVHLTAGASATHGRSHAGRRRPAFESVAGCRCGEMGDVWLMCVVWCGVQKAAMRSRW